MAKKKLKKVNSAHKEKVEVLDYLSSYVEVVWLDAASGNGWESAGHEIDNNEVLSLGWLLRVTPKEITLAADVSNEPVLEMQHNRRLTIPRGCIRTMRRRSFGKKSNKDT